MRRRDFLVLSGFSAGIALAGISLSQEQPEKRHVERIPLLVGLGDCGVNLCCELSAVLFDELQVRSSIGGKINRADGRPGRPLSAIEHANLVRKAVFSNHRQEVSRVMLLAGLSGATGGALVAPVARRYMEEGADVRVIVTLPFNFEGGHRRDFAERQLDAVRACGCDFTVVDNAESIAGLPDGLTLPEAYQMANHQVVEKVAMRAWLMRMEES